MQVCISPCGFALTLIGQTLSIETSYDSSNVDMPSGNAQAKMNPHFP